MIHYSCDRCQKLIDVREELRYEVKIEMQVALDDQLENDDERDHLNDVDELLQRIEEDECEQICQQFYQTRRYDLCANCYELYCQNPLAVEPQLHVGFSEN